MFTLANLGVYTKSVLNKRKINVLCKNTCIGFSSRSAQKNHYEILNLPRNCSSKEIRAAFITLSKQYHPDKNKGNEKAQEQFVKLNEAYSVLSKPDSRKDYDFTLLQSENPSPTQTEWKERNYDPGTYYRVHRPWPEDPWKDPSFAANRKFEEADDNYYGVKGYTRQSNSTIAKNVILFFGIILFIQILAIRYVGVTHTRYLDKYTSENNRQLEEVRRKADSYATQEEAVEAVRLRLEAANKR